ncbi:MAG TPA: 3-deoxy-D-manno-octulosonic acid transferase [Vicinamibacterales bacterium]|nr:3-deoxy-D-manno-octulosonic acid transferase [Vicinamibacterales bacterium]
MYAVYSLLILIFGVIASPYLAYQAIRYKKYIGSLGQRMGYLPVSFNLDGEESIWIHAVSVGEALTVRALISDLKGRYPSLRIFLSTTTMAGQEVARRNVQDVDAVFYFPFDLSFIVRRTLRLVRPRLFVMMETEIWPNLLHECKRMKVATVMVNGRISSRSYPRYRLVRPFFRKVLADVDKFCMQGEESARRLIDIGADPARVTVTGSLKFDSMDAPGALAVEGRGQNRVLRYFRMTSGRPVIVAGSTMREEEQIVLQAFRRIKSSVGSAVNPLLVIAPRNPERFGEVTQLVKNQAFVTVRRSDLPIDAEPRAEVVILDTIGELAQVYQIATAVFVGGSLVDGGGHNILEPAVFGKPIVFGPHMQNFKEIAGAFVAHGAGIQVQNARELEDALLALLTDPVRRARLGAAARALVESNRGAKDKSLAVIAQLLPLRNRSMGVVRPFRVVH